jgi:hypothetical protein
MAAAAAMPARAGASAGAIFNFGGGCNVGAVLTLLISLLIQLVSSCFGYLFSFGMYITFQLLVETS